MRDFLNYICVVVLCLGSAQASGANADDVVSNVCSDIQRRYDNGTLNEIMIGEHLRRKGKPFFVDFDNDGKDEILRAFPAGNRAYVWEMIDGERDAPFFADGRTALYSATHVVKYEGLVFLLFMADDPFEVQFVKELSEKEASTEIPVEMRSSMFRTATHRFDLVCKYYDD